MLTDLRSGYFCSTVSFSVTNALMCSFNSPNKIFKHEDDVRMPYFYKRAINSKVVGLRNLCGRRKSLQKSGKLKAPSQVTVLYQILTPGFLLRNITHIRRPISLEG